MATIIGGTANETITGGFVSPGVTGGTPSAAADSIVAGGGADSVRGEGGNDTIDGGAGSDRLFGGNDNDRLIGGANNDTLDGGNGFDIASYAGASAVTVALDGSRTATGDAVGDVFVSIEGLFGSDANDLLGGDGGDNLIDGTFDLPINPGVPGTPGLGNDTLLGFGGNDTLFSGYGRDSLDGGEGFDIAAYSGATGGVFISLDGSIPADRAGQGDTLVGIEGLVGSNNDFPGNGDLLVGDANANLLDGQAGNDTLRGQAGDDTLVGGAGADTLVAGGGIDWLSYASDTAGVRIDLNASSASGGDAQGDSFDGLTFSGVIGGAGGDTLVGRESGFADTLQGGDGNDSLSGGTGTDRLLGGTGDDTLEGGAGGDGLDGGGGRDWLSYASDTAGVSIDLEFNAASLGHAQGDSFNGLAFFGVIGGSGADTLAGRDRAADTLIGGGGADALFAFGFSGDVLRGGRDNDTLVGGAGADFLSGDEGNDSILGGDGNDTIDLRSTTVGTETVDAGEDNDLIFLGTGLHTVQGGAGIDTADGTGFDTDYLLDLESGATNFNESILGIETYISGIGNDTILGSSVANLILGGGGNDSLDGRGGADTLEGGAGNDTLNGGAGFDVARYTDAPGALKITLSGGQILVRTAAKTDVLTSIEAISTADGSVTLGVNLSALFGIAVGFESFSGLGTAYVGPVAGLQRQYLGSGAGEVVIGTTANDFINLLGGVDAANGGNGNDVIDGGLGSNFLTGGAGIDTFFSDGRGGGITWSTITDFQPGEQLSLFGWQPGVSRRIMVESDGAAGFKGATMHADLNADGVIDTSVTWSGLTLAQVPVPLEFADPQLLWFIG